MDEFRSEVDEIASEEFDSRDDVEMLLYHEKFRHFDLERSIPLFDLCKRIERVIASRFIRLLMDVSAQTKMRLEESLPEPIKGDCRRFAAAMSRSDDLRDLYLTYEYHPGGHAHAHIGAIQLLSIEKRDGRYRISNADRSLTLRDLEAYLTRARTGRDAPAEGAY